MQKEVPLWYPTVFAQRLSDQIHLSPTDGHKLLISESVKGVVPNHKHRNRVRPASYQNATNLILTSNLTVTAALFGGGNQTCVKPIFANIGISASRCLHQLMPFSFFDSQVKNCSLEKNF